MGTPTWFISHTHLDHLAALPVYVARRRMMKMEPPIIYLPEQAIESVERILKLFTRLDRGGCRANLRPLRPGDEIELSREHVVTVSATKHTVPSLGFVVWERRRKLKPEYAHSGRHEIRDLRLAGTDVTEERASPAWPIWATVHPKGLDATPAMYEAADLDHGNHVCGSLASQGQDPQIRPHSSGRRRRAAGAVSQRSDRRLHFSTRYPAKRIKDLVTRALPMRSPAGCICGFRA